MKALEDKLTIKDMRLRNRMALPPLTTNYGTSEGIVTDAVLAFYAERAKDVGLVIVEATAVRADGRIVPRSLGLWNDAQIAGMARLAHAVTSRGAAVVVQLNHAGARGTPSGGELQGASPSGIGLRPDVPPVILHQDQISLLTTAFADAAERAAQAGFHGVEIHGAHLYLISQFLSPFTNRRDDRYGGDATARAAFAREVVRAVRGRLGKDFPILFRINAVEEIEGGQTLNDTLEISRILREEGVDVLDVSLIAGCSWREVGEKRYPICRSALSKDQPAGANVAASARIKAATGLPVIAVGKLGDGTAAARSVRESEVDVVAIGRQMIADPDTAGKILSGQGRHIVPCEECMNCFASIGKGESLTCKVNKNLPEAHHERNIPKQ